MNQRLHLQYFDRQSCGSLLEEKVNVINENRESIDPCRAPNLISWRRPLSALTFTDCFLC